MLVDGKAIAKAILAEVAQRVATRCAGAPRLAVIACAPDFATQKYLALKQRQAQAVGIEVNLITVETNVTTTELIEIIHATIAEHEGVVVQLPLPTHLDREAILAAIPVTHDPDGFHYGADATACLPPVVGAIDEIATRHNLAFAGRAVTVLGNGRLVGSPVAHYLRTAGAQVTVLTAADTYPHPALATADGIVSGVGKPHFIKIDQLKPGAFVFDAGTSEDGGVLVGDVDPGVAATASIFTPVPGGIGPITVALLLRNLVELSERQ